MLPDWNLILGFVGVGVVLVSGFVKLRVDNAKGFASVGSRLDKIETRLEIYDEGKGDRAALRRAEAHAVARTEIREHEAGCPGREPTGVRTVG